MPLKIVADNILKATYEMPSLIFFENIYKNKNRMLPATILNDAWMV